MSFPVELSWNKSVWRNACTSDAWNITTVLSTVSYKNYNTQVPLVGVAYVSIKNAGNYSMQLLQHQDQLDLYNFYVLNTFNYTPPLHNITYNTTSRANTTYTTNNITSRYIVDPNLSFPSLDVALYNPSIPFQLPCYSPSAFLIHAGGSATTNLVLDTVTSWPSDCTQFKLCGNADQRGDFQIALGVVMIQQFLYGKCCSQPSN